MGASDDDNPVVERRDEGAEDRNDPEDDDEPCETDASSRWLLNMREAGRIPRMDAAGDEGSCD